jgi:hypothetical protein
MQYSLYRTVQFIAYDAISACLVGSRTRRLIAGDLWLSANTQTL